MVGPSFISSFSLSYIINHPVSIKRNDKVSTMFQKNALSACIQQILIQIFCTYVSRELVFYAPTFLYVTTLEVPKLEAG